MSKTLTNERIEELAQLNLGYDRQVRLRDFARAIEREVLATQQPEPRDEVKPRKVERDSDMSVLVVFCSTREASVFEKEIRARAGEGHADQA
ncbi:hypothetical protein [Burkholderia cenocepacia]|uniref:hypothetical protein n=1 Tax=Burkholderia cenocepacia TaxID=95486 RepID=UPI00158BEBFB|nr:hypothetical protein [Burkholderia cenocepacia]